MDLFVLFRKGEIYKGRNKGIRVYLSYARGFASMHRICSELNLPTEEFELKKFQEGKK